MKMDSIIKVLFFGHEKSDREFYQQLLVHHYDQDYEFMVSTDANNLLQDIGEFNPQCLLVDNTRFLQCGTSLINKINGDYNIPIIVIDDKQKSTYHNAYQSTSHLLKAEITADKLYHAICDTITTKQRDKANWLFFDDKLNQKENQAISLTHDLEEGLKNSEFYIRYQPIFDLLADKPIGFEALLRWDHPRMDIVGAQSFIPLAERSGLIVPIGEWLFTTACYDAIHWRHASLVTKQLFINISARQLEEDRFVTNLYHILIAHGIDPIYLTIEIPEMVLKQQYRYYQNVLSQIVSLGIKVVVQDLSLEAIDLNYFNYLPLYAIKIQPNLIRHICEDKTIRKKIKYIIKRSRQHNIHPIATGIETEEQLNLMYRLGCHYAQGFLICLPIKAKAVADLLISTSESVRHTNFGQKFN